MYSISGFRYSYIPNLNVIIGIRMFEKCTSIIIINRVLTLIENIKLMHGYLTKEESLSYMRVKLFWIRTITCK